MPPYLNFVEPVTLDPPQADAILATTALSLPLLAAHITISPTETITLTFPVTISPGLTSGVRITNTASVTSTTLTIPATATSIVVIPYDTLLPLILK